MNIMRKKHQSGMTLITSLMMLLAMTMMSVTAMRISIVDLLVANNYQQQLTVYQEAKTNIRREVSFHRLHDWIVTERQPLATAKGSVVTHSEVIDLKREYPCKGRSHLANSLGPNSPVCKLFMFSVDTKMKGSGAQEHHYKGVGKQFPNQ